MAKEDNKKVSAEQSVEKPKERRLRQILRERYAEELPEDDTPEAWAGLEDRFAEDVSGELEMLGKYKESEMTLNEVAEAYPEFGQILYDVAVAKMPLRVALAKHFTQEDLVPQEGDEDYDSYQEVYSQKLESSKKMKSLQQEIEANEEASIKLIDDYVEEKGLSEEQKNQLIDTIDQAFVDVLNKKVSRIILDAFYKDMVFEDEISAAEQAGEIKGRNASIEDMRSKKSKAENGDAVPVPGKGGATTQTRKISNPVFSGLKERRGI